MKTKGFTLVELLVVIAILAILATVSVVGYTSFIADANESTAMQELTQVRDALIAEDINNDNFAITTGTNGKITEKTSGSVAAFANGLGLTGTVAVDTTAGTVTYKLTDKGVQAVWTVTTNKITTGAIPVSN